MRGVWLVVMAACNGASETPDASNEVVVHVTDWATGADVAGIEVLYRGGDRIVHDLVTDANGDVRAAANEATIVGVHSMIVYQGLKAGDRVTYAHYGGPRAQAATIAATVTFPHSYNRSSLYSIAGTSGVNGTADDGNGSMVSAPIAAIDTPRKTDASVVAWNQDDHGVVTFSAQRHVDLTTGTVALGAFQPGADATVTSGGFAHPVQSASFTFTELEGGEPMFSTLVRQANANGTQHLQIAPFGDSSAISANFLFGETQIASYTGVFPAGFAFDIDGSMTPPIANNVRWDGEKVVWDELLGGREPTLVMADLDNVDSSVNITAPYTGHAISPPLLPAGFDTSGLKPYGLTFRVLPGISYGEAVSGAASPVWETTGH